jgi:DNA-directed RNA polymerase III subunit RPC1
MCPADGWVVIHNSEHLCGSLDKALLGGGNKSGLLSVLVRESSALAAAQVGIEGKGMMNSV